MAIDRRDRAFLDRKAAPARLLNGQVAGDGPTVFERV
jgi:hypothetical protein